MGLILAARDEPSVPISTLVSRDGGVSGLTVAIQIWNGADLSQFLDFSDGVFKAAGHTAPTLNLAEIDATNAPGVYAVDGGFDLSAITVPAAADSLLVRYTITAGGETGDDLDTIQFTDVVRDAVLDDATPFAGADVAAILADTAAIQPLVDVAVSTRAAPGDAMGLVADAIVAATFADDAQARNVYGGRVWIDTAGGAAGTVVGVNGTEGNPSSNLADALTIAASIGVKEFHLRGSITLTAAFNGFRVIGAGSTFFEASVNLGGQDVDDSLFERVNLTGAQGGGLCTAIDCGMGEITDLGGTFVRCGLNHASGAGATLQASGFALLVDCWNRNSSNPIRFTFPAGSGHSLILRRLSGDLRISGMDSAGQSLSTTLIGALVTLDADNVAGSASLSGIADLDDSSAGTTVDPDALIRPADLNDLRATTIGRIRVDFSAGPPRQLVVYERDGVTERFRADLTTTNGPSVQAFFGVQHERGVPV